MKLNNLLKQNKEEAFIYLERNVNDIQIQILQLILEEILED